MDFQCALYEQLEQMSTWSPHQAYLVNKIEANPCGDSTVGVVEQIVRAKLGLDPSCDYDWCTLPTSGNGLAAIDWAGLLAFIEKLLPIILPLL